jgi:hypothetical protein
MSRTHLRPILIFLLSSIVGASAQQPPSTARRTGDARESTTARGCVAESMGRYMLNHALIVKPVPTQVPAPAAEPRPESPSDEQVYELIGPMVKPHVGHQVEVVGTIPSTAAAGNAAESADPKRTAHPMTGTINVTKVTMLASTCR